MVLRIGVLVGQMLAKKCSTLSQKTDKVILHSVSLWIIFYLRKKKDLMIAKTLFQIIFKRRSNASVSITKILLL